MVVIDRPTAFDAHLDFHRSWAGDGSELGGEAAKGSRRVVHRRRHSVDHDGGGVAAVNTHERGPPLVQVGGEAARANANDGGVCGEAHGAPTRSRTATGSRRSVKR